MSHLKLAISMVYNFKSLSQVQTIVRFLPLISDQWMNFLPQCNFGSFFGQVLMKKNSTISWNCSFNINFGWVFWFNSQLIVLRSHHGKGGICPFPKWFFFLPNICSALVSSINAMDRYVEMSKKGTKIQIDCNWTQETERNFSRFYFIFDQNKLLVIKNIWCYLQRMCFCISLSYSSAINSEYQL